MNERRTPRAHLSSTPVELPEEVQFPVTPALVTHLKNQFPVTLSPPAPHHSGFAVAEHYAIDQAEQRGRQQVIEYLDLLSNKE